LTDWNLDRAADLAGPSRSPRGREGGRADKLAARLSRTTSSASARLDELSHPARAGAACGSRGIPFGAVATRSEWTGLHALRVPLVSLNAARPSWSFDGADEVAPGGGSSRSWRRDASRELVIAASAERYIVVDESKMVSRLARSSGFRSRSIPTLSSSSTTSSRHSAPDVRAAPRGKDGPVVSERGGLIADVAFTGEVLARSARGATRRHGDRGLRSLRLRNRRGRAARLTASGEPSGRLDYSVSARVRRLLSQRFFTMSPMETTPAMRLPAARGGDGSGAPSSSACSVRPSWTVP